MKLLIHLLIFALGIGLGIWWGVNHPTQAATVAARENVAISKIKTEVAKANQKFLGDGAGTNTALATTQP